MTTTDLTPQEYEDLARHEATIERHREGFVELARALLAIQTARLYRATHDTWGGYLRERWGFSRQYASYLLQALTVVHVAEQEGVTLTSERQARELRGLEEQQQRAVLRAGKQPGETSVPTPALRTLANAARGISGLAPSAHPVDELRARGTLTVVATAEKLTVAFEPNAAGALAQVVVCGSWPEALGAVAALARTAMQTWPVPVAPREPAPVPTPASAPVALPSVPFPPVNVADQEAVLTALRGFPHGASLSLLSGRVRLRSKAFQAALEALVKRGVVRWDAGRYSIVPEAVSA